MYQVLIVDDDENIRKGLYEILKDKLPPGSVSMMCDNGMVASRIIANNRIDVVITDIKMPVMSGIELLKFIREGGYATRSVVLSGFDDYNLVRDALRLGAGDYLLKPVDIGVLVATVNGMLRTMEHAGGVKRTMDSAQDQMLLEHFLQGAPIASVLVEELTDPLAQGGWCSLLCVDIVNSLYSERLSSVAWLEARLEAFQKNAPSRPRMVRGVLGDYWLLLTLSSEADQCDRACLGPLLAQIEEEQFRTVFSEQPQPLPQLRQLYSSAVSRQQQYFFDIPYSQQPTGELMPKALLEQAMEGMKSYSYPKVMESLSQWMLVAYHNQMTKREVQQELLNFFYRLLSDCPAYIPVISRSKFTDYDVFYKIENSRSLARLQKELFAAVSHYIEACINASSDRELHIIQKAKRYIGDNFADNITLSDVARHVFLHSNYFSTLFRNSTGITFREYLRQVRIKRAKELMDNADGRIYEIAAAVGYNDSAHFVRAFKAVTGMSPNEYKRGPG